MKKGSDTQIIIKALKRGWVDSYKAMYKLGVANFTTRISEIKRTIELKDRWKEVRREDGRAVRVKQYAMV